MVSVVSDVFDGSVSVLEELDFSGTSDEVEESFDDVDDEVLEVSEEVLSFEDVFTAMSDGFMDTFIVTGFAVTDELLTFSETKTPL